MTQPASHGYPDWGRSISAADIQVLSVAETLNVGSKSYGRFFVGNLPYLFIALDSNTQGARASFFYYPSAASVNVIGSLGVDVLAGMEASGPITNLGPWVEIFISAAATPTDVSLNVWQTLASAQRSTGNVHNSLISRDVTNINAGATVDLDVTSVRWGWGYWSADIENAVSFRINLYARSYLGTLTTIDFVSVSGHQAGRIILLPPQPLRIHLFNNDASSRTYLAVLNLHPGPY